MGIGDTVSGRVKKAAGDLTGDESLRRRGAQEERKGEAKRELREEQARAKRKASEVESLEHKTNPDKLAEDRSKDELYERAQQLGVEGRSEMTKDELARAVTRRQ
jgi:uncharacterized protein YjbJ (UPF0337 family)